jgi:radical SAM superfamily enzyme YgiQ (UPF0313 family)
VTPRRPRIALVVPRTPRLANRPGLRRLWASNERFRNSSFFFPLPNLGLLTLAALAGPRFDVSYFDENVAPVPAGERFDVAALTSMTCQSARAYRLARDFRRAGAHTVLGGIHPTVCRAEAAGRADTVIAGEGERPWLRFLEDFLAGRPAASYAGTPFDLDALPVPRYDLVPKGTFRAMPVQVGRGCPLRCEFCSVDAVHGTRYRHKRAERVAEEVRAIRGAWGEGRPRVFFTDDNLHLDRPFLEEMAGAVAPLGVNWMAQMDVAAAKDPRLLRRMAESGCSQLLVGFESLDASNLARLQPKGPKRELGGEYFRLVREIQSAGIRVLGMFIVGLDGDRPEVFRGLRDFIRDTQMHDAQVTIQTPLPGTALRARLEREGRLLSPDRWELHDFFHVLYRPLRLTGSQLARGQSWLYRQIHDPRAQAARQRFWLERFRAR